MNNRHTIETLTSLRFVFALFVFFHHLCWLNGFSNKYYHSFYYLVLDEFYLGVSFFFILSGFILTYVYGEKIQQNNFSLKHYFISRFAKIYPVYILTLLLAIPLTTNIMIENFSTWLVMLINHLSLTQSFVPVKSYYFSFNLVSWAVSNEMFFYLLFPFLAVKFIKSDFKILCLFFTLGTLFLVALMYLFRDSDLQHALFYINPITRLFDFVLGILLCFCIKKKNSIISNNGLVFEIGAVLLFVLFFALHTKIPRILRFSVYYWIPLSVVIVIFFYEAGQLSKWLSNKAFLLFGKISYSFYLIHYLVLKYVNDICMKFSLINDDPTVFFAIVLFCLLSSLLLGYLVYRYLELPFRNGIIRRLSR